jgi:hypothetical protein
LKSAPRAPGRGQGTGKGTGRPSAPKRNGGRHCCRPPLSLVPLVLPEGETAVPREVPAEALRPRSVPQVPSQEYRYSGSGSCGSRAWPEGWPRFPCGIQKISVLRHRLPGPYRTPTKRSFLGVLSRFLPPGGFRFRRTLEGKWVRLWLAPPPRASSFRLPGPRFNWLRSEDFRRSPRGRSWERLSVSGRPLPATGRSLHPFSESRQALNRGLSLWITGITGINMD